MEIKLNKNSWHFKMYESVVSTNPPKSLCPYFWSMVLIVCISPMVLLFKLVNYIGNSFTKLKNKLIPKKVKPELSYDEWLEKKSIEFDKSMKRQEKWDRASYKTAIVFKWVVLPLLGLVIICLLYEAVKSIGLEGLLASIGISLIVIVSVLGFITLIDNYGHKIVGPIARFLSWINPLNWEITQMIGGMIYATYKVACPMIEWEGTEETEKEESYGNS
jgi:hypothetical protein